MKLWETPVPSSSFYRGVVFENHLGRQISLSFEYEDDKGQMKEGQISFFDIIAYRVIYLYGLTGEMIESSYDELIDLGNTDWLKEIKETLDKRGLSQQERERYLNIKHYRICFDDGPCYEFICTSFETV